ncbi:hypothetical protein GL218_03313 [Daldinia childiae]|uniref:uncharacterized protein n=1 Tax=Daldinia childiae TaxID=326645 RepID=UPI001447A35F|nr:uncharacterized protein GL218_03313 [Daldinia childiae]KAF3060909.1 hypothetical protein GL218_03313 [Daldinia childiae]
MSSDQCVVCWEEGDLLCSSCKSCRYCSKRCQKNDWKSHKLLCKAISTQSERPSSFHVRAIYFPQDRPTPELVWISCLGIPSFEEVKGIVREGTPGNVDIQRVYWNYRLMKPALQHIEFHFRDLFLRDGSRPTKSLYETVAKHGQARCDWRGPLLVFGVSRSDLYTDATLADFRAVIDYSLGYGQSHSGL